MSEGDRAVTRALSSLAPPTAPTAAERRRIRDRILLALDEEADEAPHPEAVDSGAPADPRLTPVPAVPRQRGRDDAARPPATRGRSRPAGRRRGVLAGARGRFAIAAVAVLALVGSLAGMSLLLARDALPGDALYGVKRTAEAAELGLTFGDEPRALKHLEFASARVGEIETLARRYPDPADAPVGGYLTALTDFETDATAGSRQLIPLATGGDGRLLESLRDWATQQAARLRAVADRLPAAARNREVATHALLDKISGRADALHARMDCFQITSGSYDDIGALPATGECERPRTQGPPTSTRAPTGSGRPGTPSAPGGPGGTGATPPPTGPETPSPPLPSAGPTPGIPPVPVPGATVTVPVPVPSVTVPPTSGGTGRGTPVEPPPLVELPPLLPGLPGVSIG